MRSFTSRQNFQHSSRASLRRSFSFMSRIASPRCLRLSVRWLSSRAPLAQLRASRRMERDLVPVSLRLVIPLLPFAVLKVLHALAEGAVLDPEPLANISTEAAPLEERAHLLGPLPESTVVPPPLEERNGVVK